MLKQKFICRNCGHKFVAKIFEEGEAEEKKLPTAPVKCPQCRSTNVEKA